MHPHILRLSPALGSATPVGWSLVVQAGSVVQQNLSQIRTVAAYNGEEAAAAEYDSKLDLPQKVGWLTLSCHRVLRCAVLLCKCLRPLVHTACPSTGQASLQSSPFRCVARLVLIIFQLQLCTNLCAVRPCGPLMLCWLQVGAQVGATAGLSLGGMQFVSPFSRCTPRVFVICPDKCACNGMLVSACSAPCNIRAWLCGPSNAGRHARVLDAGASISTAALRLCHIVL